MPYFGPKYLGWEPSNKVISKKLLFEFSTDSRVPDYEFEALVHFIFDVTISQGSEWKIGILIKSLEFLPKMNNLAFLLNFYLN